VKQSIHPTQGDEMDGRCGDNFWLVSDGGRSPVGIDA